MRFQYFHTWRRIWPIAVFVALIIIALVPLLVLIAISNPVYVWHYIFTNAPSFVIFLLFLALIMGFMPYRNARKQFAAQSFLREPITYVFTFETVSGTGPSASWSIAWNVLKRIQETRSLFLLYQGPNIAVIVPKRFFQSTAEMEKWRELCVAHKRIDKPGVVGRWC